MYLLLPEFVKPRFFGLSSRREHSSPHLKQRKDRWDRRNTDSVSSIECSSCTVRANVAPQRAKYQFVYEQTIARAVSIATRASKVDVTPFMRNEKVTLRPPVVVVYPLKAVVPVR